MQRNYRKEIKNEAVKEIKKRIHEYGQDKKATYDIDLLQHDLNCCGADSPKNWLDNKIYPHANGSYPYSCCGKDENSWCKKPKTETSCGETIFDSIYNIHSVIFGVSIVTAVFQLLAIIMSCGLASNIRKEYEFV
ncbi:cd63-like protein [Dinothrombium tinctorium]|uniref:Cd63-like protein n=1 Tax=Dinothrombium tinctorium TaxID=1965070 RepID=A0A443QN68_9ACAR|nr:cd63-like protein [Dinothrombium tinctorium]